MRIAFICTNLSKSNANKQPWRYVVEIAKQMDFKGHTSLFITDSTETNQIDGIEVYSVKHITNLFIGESRELLSLLDNIKPDIVVMVLGVSSFLRIQFKISQPVVGILTSPLYNMKELIANIGFVDLIKFHKYTFIHVLNSLVPSFLINKWIEKFSSIVFLSGWNKLRFEKNCRKKFTSYVIPPGIDNIFFEQPEMDVKRAILNQYVDEKVPFVLYYTSPLELRGSKILINAFSEVRREMDCKLIIISRNDNGKLSGQERKLLEYANEMGIEDSICLISKYFSPIQLRNIIYSSDVVCLPFKLVISDVPISILEVVAQNKPLVTTNVASIPEYVSDHSLIVYANKSAQLSNAILRALKCKNRKASSCMQPPCIMSWENIGNMFNDVLIEKGKK